MMKINFKWISFLWFVFVGPNGVQLTGNGLTGNGLTGEGRQTGEWQPFVCDETQTVAIHPNFTRRLLMQNSDLLFFFDDFVVKVEKPLLEMVNESGVPRHSLRYRSPLYLPYSKLTQKPTILDAKYDNMTAMLQNVAGNAYDTYVITEKGRNTSYEMHLNKLIFEAGRVGDVAAEEEQTALKKGVKKFRDKVGFVHFDSQKWLQYSYVRDRIMFQLFKSKGGEPKNEGMAELRELDYLVMRSVYYETGPGNESNWAGNLIEMDANGVIYLRHLIFSHLPPLTNFTLYTQFRTKSSLKNLLECADPQKKKKQLKGLLFRQTADQEKLAYLFVDDYYLRLQTNPIESRFVLAADDLSPKRLHFKTFDARPQIERLATMKYVKYIAGRPYMTFDHEKSYTVEFEGSGESEQLVVVEENQVRAHLCSYQTLSIGENVFCFRKRTYQLVSKDSGVTPFVGGVKLIKDLFANSETMDYGDEDLELLVTFEPSFTFTLEPKQDIVFVFKSWLLKFDSYLFVVKEDSQNSNDLQIEFRFVQNIPLFMFERIQNCYYHICNNFDKEQTDLVASSTKEKRDIVGRPSIFGLFVLFFLFFALVLLYVKLIQSKKTKKNIISIVDKTRSAPIVLRVQSELQVWTELAKKKGSELIARRRTSRTNGTEPRAESGELVAKNRSSGDLKSVKSLGLTKSKSLSGFAKSKSLSGLARNKKSAEKPKGKSSSKALLKSKSKSPSKADLNEAEEKK